MPYEFLAKNGLISQGNITATGSLTVTQNITASNISASGTITATSFTGSLFGTSSWATNALSASFLPVGIYNITSSWSTNALTASSLVAANSYTVTNLTANNISASTYTGSSAYLSNIGFTDQTVASDTSIFPTGSTSGGLILDGGVYTNGLYRTRFVKVDRGANLSLYIQETKGSSGSFNNLARFGTHTNSPNTFEVFGSTNIQGSITSSNFVGPLIGNTTGTASWSTNALTASSLVAANSYTITNLTASNISASGTITSSGALINGNLIVTGSILASLFSASNIYITSSVLTVTDNIITINALSPYQRYAGIQMYDSGSGTLSNLLWDGQGDYFFLSGSGVNGKIITGPDGQTDLSSNYVPKATAGYKLGNSVIYDSGNGVGINTTSPTAKLEVAGGTLTTGSGSLVTIASFSSNNSNTSYLNIETSRFATGSGWDTARSRIQQIIDVTRQAYIDFNPSGSLYGFAIGTGAGGNERLRIDSSGNIGIGTTNPIRPLQVYSSNNAPFLLQGTTAGVWMDFQSSTSNLLSIGADGTNGIGFYNRTTSANLMTISSAGNVGIGTTVPGNLLEIYAIPSTTSSLRQMLTINTDYASATGTGFGGAIVFKGRTPGNVLQDNAQIVAYNEDTGDNGYALGFYTRPTVLGGLQQRMTILRGGYVGIGTISPTTRLHVSGSHVSGNGMSRFEASDFSIISLKAPATGDGAAGYWGFRAQDTSNNDLMFYGYRYLPTFSGFWIDPDFGSNITKGFFVRRSDGSVGIGTSSPNSKLHVNSSGSLVSGSVVFRVEGTQGSLFSVDDTLTGSLMSVNDITGLPILEVFSDDRVVMGTFNTNTLVVTGSRVGIGTNSPGYKLEVIGDARFTGGIFNSSLSAQWIISGGGTVTYNGSAILWSNRVILIPVEKDELSVQGYIDIGCPTSGTITYYNSSNVTTTVSCAASGVPMSAWEALYYEITPGQTNPSDQTRFRLVNYINSTWRPSSNWILICALNGDSNSLRWIPGQVTIPSGGSFDSSNSTNNWQINGTTNYVPKFTAANKVGNSLIYDTGTNIGIGTTTPASKLTSYINSTTGIIDAIRLQVPSYSDTAKNTIVWAQDNSNYVLGRYGLEWNNSTSQMNFIWRDVFNSGTGSTELMRLTGGGNVGIGTTSPVYKLHVTGDIYANGGSVRVSGTNAFYFESYAGGFYMSDTTWIRSISDKNIWVGNGLLGAQGGLTVGYGGASPSSLGAIISGSVGIGTSSPATKLDVYGPVSVRGTTVLTTNFDLNAGNAADIYGNIRVLRGASLNDGMFIGYGGAGGPIRFYSNSGTTEFMQIATSGNVGIGSTSPAALLNIRASAPTGTGAIPTGTNVLIDSNTSNYLTFRNTVDNGTYAGLIFLDNNIGGYVVFGNAGAGAGSDSMIYGAYQDHIFQNGYVNENLYNRTETMRIKQNGYVGINTNNPTGRLHIVQGNSGGVAAILLSTDESTIQGPSANTQIRMGSNLVLNASGVIPIGTNGSERVRIDSSGNVGIGTTTAGRKLDVEGIVRTRGASGTGGFEISVASTGTAKWRIEWDSASDSLDFNWVG